MKNKLVLSLATAAMIAAPLAPASAHGWDHRGWGHGGGGLLFGVGAAVGAVAGAAVTLATAPFQMVGAMAAPGPAYAVPEYPGPQPMAYPAPVAYGYAPAYYAPQPVAVVGYPGYYGRPHFVRAGYYGYGHRY
jgi:hypothetical protein